MFTVTQISWQEVYRKFMNIADEVSSESEIQCGTDQYNFMVELRVEALYALHKGEPAWDIAYSKWCEPCCDSEEV